MIDPKTAAGALRILVQEAGALALAMQGTVTAREKADGSGPVTEADLAAERVLLEGLAARFPGSVVVSEETRREPVPAADAVWCVDPIDGTHEYALGLPEYACMAGLLADGEPVAGAFCVPADGAVFWGFQGGGAFRNDTPLTLDGVTDMAEATVIHSRSHRSRSLAAALERLGAARTLAAGGVGYKVGKILLGRAHVYVHPRPGTMWWDSTGPAAVLLAAGGFVANARGEPLRYSAQGLEHEHGLLFATGGVGEAAASRLRPGG